MSATKKDIISQLRRDMLLLQGFKPASSHTIDVGLGPITAAFPNAVFPTGAIHEFFISGAENAAASSGFTAALIAPLMASGGACLWISSVRKIFPPGLKAFGVEPDRIIFIDVRKERDVLWAMEEALKCEGLTAVIGELQEISFTASRRLQLAVEQSRVTGFLLRHNPRNQHANACVARWKIMPLASEVEPGMPGIGCPRWNVELTRIRNGQPGTWQMEWSAGRFRPIFQTTLSLSGELRKPEEQGVSAERTQQLSAGRAQQMVANRKRKTG